MILILKAELTKNFYTIFLKGLQGEFEHVVNMQEKELNYHLPLGQ